MPDLDQDDEPDALDHLTLDPDAFDARPTPDDLAPFLRLAEHQDSQS